MIGGTSRDYLLEREVLDYDFVTDATPEEMKRFLDVAKYTFANSA
jgi:tRNA nucleotidyltransferase/poly(A) polymerase